MLVSFLEVRTKGQAIAKRRRINPFVPKEWMREFICASAPFARDYVISRKRPAEPVNEI